MFKRGQDQGPRGEAGVNGFEHQFAPVCKRMEQVILIIRSAWSQAHKGHAQWR